MRILSDFHDYYDVVQKLGQDRELLYIRKKKEINATPFTLSRQWAYGYTYPHADSVAADPYLIGFCGKLYLAIHMEVGLGTPNHANDFCYSLDEVDNFVEKHCKKRVRESYRDPKAPRWREAPPIRRRRYFENQFAEVEQVRDKRGDFFLKHQVPLFIVPPDPRKTVLNGCLKDVAFFKVFDPYRAYQEIQMYWGGMAKPEKPIPPVSDKDMIIGKGFDPKWSFRKPPAEEKP